MNVSEGDKNEVALAHKEWQLALTNEPNLLTEYFYFRLSHSAEFLGKSWYFALWPRKQFSCVSLNGRHIQDWNYCKQIYLHGFKLAMTLVCLPKQLWEIKMLTITDDENNSILLSCIIILGKATYTS